MQYIPFLPVKSDIDDQKNRPPRLHNDSNPTYPAAAAGVTLNMS